MIMIILIEIMEKYASSDKEFGINLARGKNVYEKLFLLQRDKEAKE